MANYLRPISFTTFYKITIIGALVLLNACGDASKNGSQTTQSSGSQTPQSSVGDPPSPTNLAEFVEILASGAIEGVQTASKMEQDAFFAKNSKEAIAACMTDKLKNDPKFSFDGSMGDPSMDKYLGRLTDDNPIFEVIKKYGIKESNPQTKLAYQMWVQKAAEASVACIVQ
jgi:hypothetical protein